MGGHLDVDRVTRGNVFHSAVSFLFPFPLIQLALGYTELRFRDKRSRGLLELKVDLSCGGLISYPVKVSLT